MTAVTFCMTNTHTRVGMARARVVSRGLISRGSVAVVHLVRQSQSVAGHQDGWSLFLLVIMSRPVSVTTCHVHVSQEVEMTEGAGHHEREIRRDRGEVRSG